MLRLVLRNARCSVYTSARTGASRQLMLANMSSSTSSISEVSSMFAKVGRDIPLRVIPRAERRAARQSTKHSVDTSVGHKVVRTSSLPAKISFAVLAGSISGSILWHFVLDDKMKNRITDTLGSTFLGDIYTYIAKKVEEAVKPFTDPSRQKLLPDWPIPQVPADTPPVPVLVLDLEDTLVHSEWSRKHGWRHAKRPGVDEFLETLCQYYEIVIFSQNYGAEEIVQKLDPKQCALHILSRDATRYLNGAHVKDLANLNRDLKQVVILDDDPAAYQLQPENAIPIKPFTNGRDRDDHALKDLIPFLKALASERVPDFRQVIGEFRDDDGVVRDLATKYAARVHQLEMQKEQKKKKGFGGFVRGRLSHHPTSPTGSVAASGFSGSPHV
ncbi:mitochondrial import inner membrane translocase subunit tim50 [Plasmopara halstedii]|uniref:Mitochondrial import inner membrane translocase subunit TIM50 n=1 Tax=Plasmopara halstedii TaxID=4781 RepID=A0A0P1A8K0_PLAHL|nr:mitochondrial import inner membrane translocase subunit tim50 [Plasmopara halstedii]CEG36520.1 mitochondrial import inner membrane translocase subunit tim50 [Plasmopara halstedii]|eukprot:XP_024572889.1 mitochondrial import inner membrane translocase subunit tim50 [Plasmopara halstedii]